LQTSDDEEIIPDTPGANASARSGGNNGNSSTAALERVTRWLDQQFADAINEYVDPIDTNPRSPLSVTSNDASVNQSRASQGAVTFQVLEPVPEEQRQDETDEQYLQRLLTATKLSRDEVHEINKKMQARIVQLREESNKVHMQLVNTSTADINKLRDQMQKLKQRSAKKDADFERLSKQVEITTNAYKEATDTEGNPIDVRKMLKDHKRVCEQLSRANIEALTAQGELREVNGEIDRLLEQKEQRTQEANDALVCLKDEKERYAALEDTLHREREQYLTQADEQRTQADQLKEQLEEAARKLEAYENPTNRSNNAILTRSGGPCPHCPKLVEDVKAAKKECKSLRALNESSLKEADRIRSERDAAKEAAATAQQQQKDTKEALKAQITVLEDDLKDAQKTATEHLLAHTKAMTEIQSLKRNQTRPVPTLQDIESPQAVRRSRQGQ
jgi:chromosome segregation ATPase